MVVICVKHIYSIYSLSIFNSYHDCILFHLPFSFSFLFFVKYFIAVPRHQVILAPCAWRCICISQCKNVMILFKCWDSAVWELRDTLQTRWPILLPVRGNAHLRGWPIEQQCSQRKPGDNRGDVGIREMSDLNQEQGNSKYYVAEDGWLGHLYPRRWSNETGIRGPIGLGQRGLWFCGLWFGWWWSQLSVLCGRENRRRQARDLV